MDVENKGNKYRFSIARYFIVGPNGMLQTVIYAILSSERWDMHAQIISLLTSISGVTPLNIMAVKIRVSESDQLSAPRRQD